MEGRPQASEREQTAREQTAREQTAREQTAREHAAHLPLASRLFPAPAGEREVRARVARAEISSRERRATIFAARSPDYWLRLLQSDDPQQGLTAVLYLLRHLREHETRLVQLARSLGYSWGAISARRGVSRQALHRRYARDAPGPGSLAT